VTVVPGERAAGPTSPLVSPSTWIAAPRGASPRRLVIVRRDTEPIEASA